jgi:hypothetical protein
MPLITSVAAVVAVDHREAHVDHPRQEAPAGLGLGGAHPGDVVDPAAGEEVDHPPREGRALGHGVGVEVGHDGGAGLDAFSYALVMEEVSAACASSGVIMSVNNSLFCDPVYKFGTETQKQEILSQVASGQVLGCFGLTEPMSGSDAQTMATTATKVDGGWVINGAKNWITNGPHAEHLIVFAITEKAPSGKVKHTAFLVKKGTQGFTQNPRDLPENVLAHLGTRIQHALRAYTPTERKGVKAAAQSFRPNPGLDTEAAITELGTGEALVSTLDVKGAPTVVERTLIRPPASRLGPATDAERAAVQALSPVVQKYDTPIDRESAYEILTGREAQAAREKDALKRAEAAEAEAARARKQAAKEAAASRTTAPARTTAARAPAARKSTRQTPVEAAGSTFMRTATRELTKFVFRGMFGNRKR